MKLWQMEITPENTSTITLLWCEKGPKTEEVLNLDDFHFLAPFMSIESANELWPDTNTWYHYNQNV